MRNLIVLLLATLSFSVLAQSPKVEIDTKNNSDREKAVIPLLEELLEEYDLSKWIFTKKVRIEERVIPHSHPILTLNTRYGREDKVQLLSTFIHEQLHWYVDDNTDWEKKAIAEFKTKYKDVPYKNVAGARDEYSTYLHLIVCYLEYRSMASLIGEKDAKQLMWNQTHYTWIYNKVIDDMAYIGKVLKKNKLNLVD